MSLSCRALVWTYRSIFTGILPQAPCCVNTPVSVSNGTMDGMLLSDLIPFQFGGEGVGWREEGQGLKRIEGLEGKDLARQHFFLLSRKQSVNSDNASCTDAYDEEVTFLHRFLQWALESRKWEKHLLSSLYHPLRVLGQGTCQMSQGLRAVAAKPQYLTFTRWNSWTQRVERENWFS